MNTDAESSVLLESSDSSISSISVPIIVMDQSDNDATLTPSMDNIMSDDIVLKFDEPKTFEDLSTTPTTPTFELSTIIANEQARLSDTLTGGTSSISKKRKATAPSISLLSFVNILLSIYNDMMFDPTLKEMRFKRNISAYIDEYLNSETKRTKMDVQTSASIEKYPTKFKQRAINCILNKLYSHLESQNMQFQFPKEMLKFFLATYTLFITPTDFANTNTVVKTERKAKNSSPLSNGLILQEYVKGFDVFVSNMSRSEHNDIKALKSIVENKLSIPYHIYDLVNKIKFTPPNYIVDAKMEIRPDHTHVMIANSKQLCVLITLEVVLYFDGNQFTIPQANIEREFNMNIKRSSQLKCDDYILLEVLAASKIKVLDVLKFKVGNDSELPSKYSDRLKLIQKILPNITIAPISHPHQVCGTDASYIQKPSDGFGPTYVYHKSNLIAAAIGIMDKAVVLAFAEDDSTLVVKLKTSISGAVTCCVSIMAYTCKPSTVPKIKVRGVEYGIVGDLNGVKLFEDAIIVEVRDGNRLGYLSSNPVSRACDYKPVTIKREAAVLMNDVTKKFDNPEFVSNLFKNITKSQISITDEQRKMILNWLEPDVGVSFDGYNTM